MKANVLYTGLFSKCIMNQTNSVDTNSFFDTFYSTIRRATINSNANFPHKRSSLSVGLGGECHLSKGLFSASPKQPSFFDDLGIDDVTPRGKD